MTTHSRNTILETSRDMFAVCGYEGFSIRKLAAEAGLGISSIYHFFDDKDIILKEVYELANKRLGLARASLPQVTTASAMLLQRIDFQFTHIDDIVFVLKYYLHFRQEFQKLAGGYLPAKGYLHIEEVLKLGVKSGDFTINESEIDAESKVIAHAINGFLLEYYPNPPKDAELTDVVNLIHKFLMRSLTNKEVVLR